MDDMLVYQGALVKSPAPPTTHYNTVSPPDMTQIVFLTRNPAVIDAHMPAAFRPVQATTSKAPTNQIMGAGPRMLVGGGVTPILGPEEQEVLFFNQRKLEHGKLNDNTPKPTRSDSLERPRTSAGSQKTEL